MQGDQLREMTVACARVISIHVLRSDQATDKSNIQQKGFDDRLDVG